MELNELLEIQKKFDSEHGWTLNNPNALELIEAINKDLIGLFGEIGEFSNIVKKINLKIYKVEINEIDHIISNYKEALSEELIDSLIYLLRIVTHLNLDVTKAYLCKLEENRERYKAYETTK
jgi:NTP pyrophosphatase (non-canonical NTP hydrolase)